jgi:predicted alpha/beta-fold hydrolase
MGGRALDAAAAGQSVGAFDALVTAPAAGYASAAACYRAASTHERLEAVAIPLLCVAARDDPVCCGASMPTFACRNERVAFVETARGGHLGFVDARGGLSDCWADRVVGQFFDQLQAAAS